MNEKERQEELLKMLHDELADLLRQRKTVDIGSDEYNNIEAAAKALVGQIVSLNEVRNEIVIEELKQDGEAAKLENNIEVETIKQSVPKTRVILDLVKVFAPPIMYFGAQVWGTNKAQKFEASGYQLIMKSSQEIKNFLNKMLKM